MTLRVCLGCRLVGVARACGCGADAVRLGEPAERQRLLDAMWPAGARSRHPVPANVVLGHGSTRGVGRVLTATGLVAPGQSVPCAGWALTLKLGPSADAPVTLRVGRTAGLDVALPDAVLHLAAGPLWISGDAVELGGAADATGHDVEAVLRELDPMRALGAELRSPLPWSRAALATVQVGELVEVVAGGADAGVVTQAAAGPFRTLDVPRRVAQGLPTLVRRGPR